MLDKENSISLPCTFGFELPLGTKKRKLKSLVVGWKNFVKDVIILVILYLKGKIM
jgi:hypothetical protein